MARIRSVKPDYWKSEKMAMRCPGPDGREARRVFIGLWNLAEDHGVLRGNAAYIRAELYPYDEDVTTADVARWLSLLERGGFVVRFERDGSTYLWVRTFKDHQRINHPSKPTLPAPSDAEMSALPPAANTLPEPSRSPPVGLTPGGGGGREVEVEREVEREAAKPPLTIQKVPVTVTAPDKTPDGWDGDDFWAWAQSVRQDAQLVAEAKPGSLSLWFNRALMTEGVTVHALKEAFYAFGQDKHWEKHRYPFKAFMQQWASFARKDVKRVAS